MEQTQKSAAQDQRSIRVALIDDDVELKVFVEDLLREIEGYEYDLIWINDSERAELLLARSGVDVCLLDHMMGKRNAIEILERLNGKAIEIPVILLTPAEDTELVHEAQERGIYDYLVQSEITKPLLCRAIRYAIRRHALEQKVERLSLRDPLTDLYNRAYFLEALDGGAKRAARQHRSYHVVMVDVDGLAEINDAHGHQAGDRLLVEMGQRLRYCLRDTDVVARLGGDEFAILLEEGEQPLNITGVLDRLRGEIAFDLTIDETGTSVPVSASIGLACNLSDNDDPSSVVDRADRAMYEAKHQKKIA
ncbi:GGDEF domain-containing protein [Limibacillus halophilus]